GAPGRPTPWRVLPRLGPLHPPPEKPVLPFRPPRPGDLDGDRPQPLCRRRGPGPGAADRPGAVRVRRTGERLGALLAAGVGPRRPLLRPERQRPPAGHRVRRGARGGRAADVPLLTSGRAAAVWRLHPLLAEPSSRLRKGVAYASATPGRQ